MRAERLDGERRLTVEFESVGSLGTYPQTFGPPSTAGVFIVPHGLRARFSAFGQKWAVAIDHTDDVVHVDPTTNAPLATPVSCVSYAVTNLKTNETIELRENAIRAVRRSKGGRTMCNQAFREAVTRRRDQIEAELKRVVASAAAAGAPSDSLAATAARYALEAELHAANTKRVSEGPLYYGLRHAAVQLTMRRMLAERDAVVAAAAPLQPVAAAENDDNTHAQETAETGEPPPNAP